MYSTSEGARLLNISTARFLSLADRFCLKPDFEIRNGVNVHVYSKFQVDYIREVGLEYLRLLKKNARRKYKIDDPNFKKKKSVWNLLL